jgi:hypothetical protein
VTTTVGVAGGVASVPIFTVSFAAFTKPSAA